MKYDILDLFSIDLYKIMLDLSHYTMVERARIFYNHIYYSQLNSGDVASVLEDRRYRQVVRHANYNPRLIDHVTRLYRHTRSDQTFAEFVIDTLDRPTQLWRHIFESDITTYGRYLLYALASIRSTVLLEDLRGCLAARIHPEAIEDELAMERTLRSLEGTFIRLSRDENSGQRFVGFADPSVRDFILAYLDGRSGEVAQLVRTAQYFEQVALLWAYSVAPRTEGEVGRRYYEGMADAMAENVDDLAGAMIRTYETAGPRLRHDRGMSSSQRLATAMEVLGQHDAKPLRPWLKQAVTESRDAWVAICRSGTTSWCC